MKIATSLVALVVLAVAAPARAQTAEAETLFREGKRLMKKGDIAEACKRFEASERLDPGIGTELNLGNCLERNHQTASAWAMFVKAAASAKRASDGKREGEARRRAAALEKQLVYLTIVVPDDDRVPGLQIKRNDTPVDATLWGQRTPIDPDEYTITAQADGYAPWTKSVTIRSKSRVVEVPELEKQAGTPEVAPAQTTASRPVATAQQPAAPPAPAAAPPSHLRKAPLALAVVGVAGIGAGVVLGALSRSDESSSDATCPTTACSDAHALDLNSRARTEALGADIGFAIGGAALATAVVWWFVAGTSTTEQLAVMPSFDHVGIVAAGRF